MASGAASLVHRFAGDRRCAGEHRDNREQRKNSKDGPIEHAVILHESDATPIDPRWQCKLCTRRNSPCKGNGHGGGPVCRPFLHYHVTTALPDSLEALLLQYPARLLTGERPELTQPRPLPAWWRSHAV